MLLAKEMLEAVNERRLRLTMSKIYGKICMVFLTMCCWVGVYIVMNGKERKCKREYVGSFQVNKSKHILSIKLPHCHDTIEWNPTNAKVKANNNRSSEQRHRTQFANSQFMSKTKLVSLGSTSLVFSAWHVNIEFKSDLWTDGHSRRFSITSPELCSVWSSTCKPFMSQRTSGDGRPGNKSEK